MLLNLSTRRPIPWKDWYPFLAALEKIAFFLGPELQPLTVELCTAGYASIPVAVVMVGDHEVATIIGPEGSLCVTKKATNETREALNLTEAASFLDRTLRTFHHPAPAER